MSNGIPFYLTNLLVLRNQIHCWTITKDVVYIYKKKKKSYIFLITVLWFSLATATAGCLCHICHIEDFLARHTFLLL